MTTAECVKMLLSNQGLTIKELADKLGYKGRGTVTTALSVNRKDGMTMQIDILIRYLDALDAQLVIQPLDGSDEFILDGESEL